MFRKTSRKYMAHIFTLATVVAGSSIAALALPPYDPNGDSGNSGGGVSGNPSPTPTAAPLAVPSAPAGASGGSSGSGNGSGTGNSSSGTGRIGVDSGRQFDYSPPHSATPPESLTDKSVNVNRKAPAGGRTSTTWSKGSN